MAVPWRTGMPDRPALDLGPMVRAGRPRKRWRWVGVFAEDVLLCVGSARIGPVPVSWWAVWDRRAGVFAERTVRRPLDTPAGEVAGTPVETISSHDGNPIWTRKTPARFSGTARVGGRSYVLDSAPGLIDESAGYHARHTTWRWTAGVGTTSDGRAVAFNHCAGMHDAPEASERTVWVDGEPHHVGPDAVDRLAFTAEATRVHREDLWLVATDYEQPFGSFSGELPVAGAITGLGVIERQSVRW